MKSYSSRRVRNALLISTILCAGLSSPALAQSVAAPADPWVATDENGVDLTNGRFYLDIVEGSIGSGDGALSLVRYYGQAGLQDNWSGTLLIQNNGLRAVLALGRISETFTRSGSTWVSTKANGGTLVNSASGWIYQASDGTQITYQRASSLTLFPDVQASYAGPGCGIDGNSCGLPTLVKRPNGVVFNCPSSEHLAQLAA